MGRIAVVCNVLLIALGCSSGDAAADPSAGPSARSAVTIVETSPRPSASVDPEGLCRRVDELELSVARLEAIDLKITNRVPLDIELAGLLLAFDELQGADLGEFEDQLENPMQRLEYRLTELELAVEDFRTNRRPRRAASHVEDDAGTFSADVAAFRVLARC